MVKLKASVPIATSRLGNGKLCRTESCSGEDNFVAKLGKNPGLVTAAGVGGTRKNSVYRPGRMRIRLRVGGRRDLWCFGERRTITFAGRYCPSGSGTMRRDTLFWSIVWKLFLPFDRRYCLEPDRACALAARPLPRCQGGPAVTLGRRIQQDRCHVPSRPRTLHTPDRSQSTLARRFSVRMRVAGAMPRCAGGFWRTWTCR